MARQFNGSSDKGVNSSALAGVGATNSKFTISVWVYPDSTSAGEHTVVNFGQAAGYVSQLRRDGSDWNFYTSPGDKNATFAGGVTAGVWTHLAATYDQANMKLYVNGVLKQTTAQTNMTTAGAINHLGVEFDNASAFWDGRIAELALWASDIGAADIATLAAAGISDQANWSSVITTPADNYWALGGFQSPEQEYGGRAPGAFTFAMTGTTRVAGPFGSLIEVVNAKGLAISNATSGTATIVATVGSTDLYVEVAIGSDPAAVQTVSSITATGATFVFLGALTKTSGTQSSRAELWAARGIPSGITSVTVNLSAAGFAGAGIIEIFGVQSLGPVTTNSGTTANPTITATTQDNRNVLFAALASEGTAIGHYSTSLSGIMRNDNGAGGGTPAAQGGAMDMERATAGSATCTAQFPANPWAAVAVELRSVGPGMLPTLGVGH